MTANDHNLRTSQPHPGASHAEAVERVQSTIAAEINFNPASHTFLLTHGARTAKAIALVHGYASSPAPFKEIAARFFDRGYNVLAMTLPYHGLADRMNTEHAKLRAEDLVRYADAVVDIARGLGERVTMAGISLGGLITGWAAQQRQDLDLAVPISPGFGFKAVPRAWTPLMGWAWRVFPNMYVWDDPEKKADSPRTNNYLRLSTHVLGQILRLSGSIQASARGKAPAAGSMLVITNGNDPAVDNTVTGQVVDLWRARRAQDVRTYQFPADLGLGHDIISVDDPNMNVPMVYPKLLELIDP
ncbi:MAG TPA: alpha/beta fold hydrolase [Candidatus Eisenbacteria bacterium]